MPGGVFLFSTSVIIISMTERIPQPEHPAEKDPGFADFLSRVQGAEKLEFNPGSHAKHYENYENGKKALTALGGFYKTEIGEQLGVKVDAKEFGPGVYKELKDYILSEAIENPEKVKEILEKTERHNELKAEIKNLDETITKEGGEENRESAIEQLKRQEILWSGKKFEAEGAAGIRGFLNIENSEAVGWLFRGISRVVGWLDQGFSVGEAQYKQQQEIRKAMRVKTGKERVEFLDYVGNKIKDFNDRRAVLEAAPELRKQAEEELKNVRVKFFVNFEGAKDLLALVNAKINKNLNKLVNEGYDKDDIKKLEEAQQLVKKVGEGSERLGAELELTKQHGKSKIATKHSSEEYVELLDKKIDSIALGLLNEKIKSTPIAHKPLNNLYEGANKLLQSKSLGSKDRESTKEFFLSALREQAQQIIKSVKNKTKVINRQIKNLKDPDWVEAANKKAGKGRKKLTEADIKSEIAGLQKEKDGLLQDQRLKAVVLNFTLAKLANS